MLQRLGKSSAASEKAADISKAYRQQEHQAKSWCLNLRVHAMNVSFEGLAPPDQILLRLAGFLGIVDKLSAMSACIDLALHRARKSPPPSDNGLIAQCLTVR